MLLISCHDGQRRDRADARNKIDSTEVPASVQSAFNSRYPLVTEIIWEGAHEGTEDTYKVKFKKRTEYLKAEYAIDGRLIKVEEDE